MPIDKISVDLILDICVPTPRCICAQSTHKNIPKLKLDIEDPWTELLSSVAWAIRSTNHTTLNATPAQLVFGRDMIYPLQYTAEWDIIKKRKSESIQKSNVRENKKRIKYSYKIGDKILIKITDIQRKLDCPTKGPFEIIAVHEDTGNVTIKKVP